MANKESLNKVAYTPKESVISKAKQRKKNRKWLNYSQDIALLILDELDSQKLSQKKLAELMNVSPQYVNKLVRGKQKLNIETIATIETALGISIIKIANPKEKENPKPKPGRIIKVDFKRKEKKSTYSTIQEAQG